MSHLTQDERAVYTSVFLDFDKNGDGYLNVDELHNIMCALGHHLSPLEVLELFVVLDTDKNRKITLDEFLAVMPKVDPKARMIAALRRLFLTMDKNKDGILTETELKNGLSRGKTGISEQQAKQLIQQVDVDGDGRLNYEEFLVLMAAIMEC